MDLSGFSANVCGIVYPGAEYVEACLPLERADVHANVIDVSAIVTFTQHFWQHDPAGLQRAKYVFPVPARAAVCGFEMTTEKGGVIIAIAKEKGEARREHDQAISDGFFSGLVEHVTDDIFSISLGALPGLQMLQTKVTYVLDLMDADVVDQVRLQIPVHIGTRYGDVPEGMQGVSQVPPSRISISADVRMQGAITSIASPTHPTVLVSDSTTPSAQQNATYTSPEFLTQDFVLSIKAAGLDAPRCFAQRTPAGVTALQLSVVPQFHLPPVPRQEYVFVVDRSGSMEGGRIATARKALVMLLRALPMQGTHLNIFSFGSHCDSLWAHSVPYNAETLDQATRHVDSMQADYGGTEIQNALSMAIESRKTDIPAAYFILTDGESYNTAHTISTVEKAVQSAATEAPLRIFTLGIGSTTSSELCEGVARAGNGICLMTTTAEGIVGKCAKLVRASRTYILKKASVDWGEHISPAAVRQAPTQLPPLYPGTRFVVFALIDDPAYTLPNAVVIRAQRDGQGEALQLSVPVQPVDFPDGHPQARLVPTLAARRAIMDLEDAARKTRDVDHKSAIVKLGTTYQLVSKYTSFVAVDKNTCTDIPNEAAHAESTERVSPGPMSLTQYPSAWDAAQTLPTLMEIDDDDSESDTPPTIWAKAPPPQLCPAPSFSAVAPLQLPRRARSAAPPSPMSTDVSSANEAYFALPASSRGPDDDSDEEDWCEAPVSEQYDFQAVPTLYAPAPEPAPEDDKVLALVRLQAFDGSFPAIPALEEIIRTACLREAQNLQVDEKAWATALAVVFLQRHMQDEPELLDGLVEKAMEYLGQFPGMDFDALIERAGVYVD